ncbi:MAG: response regulator transcription factor [Bacteroidia bacterium]|nr:response regulator transcription factor [Bacteroidia bacterium]
MIKAIIIDDEPNSLNALSKMVQNYCPDLQVVATADTVATGIAAITEHKPDLVFLDIELPDKTGFELLASLEPVDFEVIFTTGHEEYAIKAFKTAAIDYLLKPIDIEELERAVDKVVDKRKKSKTNQNFDVLIQNWKNAESHQIALSSSEGFIFVKIKDIIYCKGDGAYTYFFLKSGEKIIVSKNLKEFEDLLDDQGFFRTHKSYLINLNEMKKYVRGDGGYVVMSNGDNIDVSKRKKESFLSNLSKI